VIICFILLIYFVNRLKKKGKEEKHNESKPKSCDECGKIISSFGGSFDIDGKTVCPKCEKVIRLEGKKESSVEDFKNKYNGPSEDLKLLTLIEMVGDLTKQQQITNRTLGSIHGMMLIFFILFLIGILFLFLGV
jgi:cbb3-type cytochrome oxidase subunit 3/phage FluMu protein Com